MALVFIDGFDHLTTATMSAKGYKISGSPLIGANGSGRHGATGRSAYTQDIDQMLRAIPSAATYTAGFGVHVSQFNYTGRFFSFLDAGSLQMELRWSSPELIRVTRNGTTLATGTTSLNVATWYWIEFQVTVDNTVGAYEVRINGSTELSATNVDTQSTANANINGFALGQTLGAQGSFLSWDDLYLLDSSGGAPTDDFLGDVRVETLLPSGNGNSSQWVGQDADSTDNYLNVDEQSTDSDTTYNESATVGNKDTYAYTDLDSTTGTVYGVAPVPYFRKTNAGSKTLVSVARLSGTEVDSASKLVLDTYAYNQDIRETKPGGGAWTISDVNSAEFGIKVTS